ncbi:MAG TPA: ATP-binding domain-containing protein, partial [Tetrasphaera sp.]|uniref:ATP-binding domain-containing protein n=1 Tax=Nostocoides sp. TaxID=1917966 RepID=UPI002BF40FB7
DGASAAPSPSQDGDVGPAVIEDVPAAAPSPVQSVARLRHTYRFGGTIGELAEAIRAGDAAATLRLLTGGAPEATLIPNAEPRKALLVASALTLRERALDGDARGALDALAHHRLLCAHRTGPVGVTHWNRLVTQWLSERVDDNFWAAYYPGRPLLVTTNDYGMDLFNGDTGVVLRRDGRLIAAFDRGTQTREIAVARFSDVETMYAATVHKSQGSQAEHVTVVLPEMDSPLLTRELIYTAVTRAQREVTVIGTPAAIGEGLARRSVRASGLRQRLTQDFPTLSPQS